MSSKTKVLLKKKTTTPGTTASKTTKPTTSVKTKGTTSSGKKTRNRLMSIGFGAKDDLIKKIDVVARKKDMTRAKFMKVTIEKAIGLR